MPGNPFLCAHRCSAVSSADRIAWHAQRGQEKTSQAKVSTDFKASVDRFQHVQKQALSKQKSAIKIQKAELEDGGNTSPAM